MKKKEKTSAKKNPVVLDLMCKRCGHITHHSLMKNGDYDCVICGNTDKHVNIPVKEPEYIITVKLADDEETEDQVTEQELDELY